VTIVLPADDSNRNYSLGIDITPGAGANITSVIATIYTNATTQNITNIGSSIIIPMPNNSNSFVEVS
jgi:hypothetical protein